MTEEEHLRWEGCENRVVLRHQGLICEVELETVDGRGDGLTSVGAAGGDADEASDGLTSLGVAVGASGEANDEVEFG